MLFQKLMCIIIICICEPKKIKIDVNAVFERLKNDIQQELNNVWKNSKLQTIKVPELRKKSKTDILWHLKCDVNLSMAK